MLKHSAGILKRRAICNSELETEVWSIAVVLVWLLTGDVFWESEGHP